MSTLNYQAEKTLFERISLGDEDAFREVFHQYNKTLFPFILSLVKSETDSREIIQEIFLKLWMNRAFLHRIDNPGGWLHTMAANNAYSFLRKEARYAMRQQLAGICQDDTSPDLIHQLDSRETKALICEAIEQLPLRRRQVFQLSRMEGYSRKEIAHQLNISENTVRNQLVDAISFVQDYLHKKGTLYLLVLIYIACFGK